MRGADRGDAGRTDAEVAEINTATLGAATRMSTLIDRTLELARAGSVGESVPVDLAEVVKHVWSDLEPLVGTHDASLVPGHLPTVLADADLLFSVMLNLISNAVKYAAGIPLERRAAVFELWTRLDDDGQGSGIGLDTVRRAVAALGGRVGIEDAESGGTAVWFTLPAAAPD